MPTGSGQVVVHLAPCGPWSTAVRERYTFVMHESTGLGHRMGNIKWGEESGQWRLSAWPQPWMWLVTRRSTVHPRDHVQGMDVAWSVDSVLKAWGSTGHVEHLCSHECDAQHLSLLVLREEDCVTGARPWPVTSSPSPLTPEDATFTVTAKIAGLDELQTWRKVPGDIKLQAVFGTSFPDHDQATHQLRVVCRMAIVHKVALSCQATGVVLFCCVRSGCFRTTRQLRRHCREGIPPHCGRREVV